MARPLFMLLALVVLAAGCASLAGGTHYRCGDGKAFSARYGLGEALMRLDGGREQRLPAVKTTSGDKYSDGRTTLWVRGREAYLERADQPAYFGCRAER